jgi:PAS domain S-box-containing protein
MLYVVLLTIAVVVDVSVALYAWTRRAMPGGIYLALLMAAAAIWALANAVEIAVLDIPTKIFWSKVSYVGIVNVPPLWLLFTLSYSQRTQWFARRRVALLWVVPAIILGLVATNELHHLVWPRITPDPDAPGLMLIYEHGPGVWLNMLYSYPLLLLGTIWLVQVALSSAQLYRRQVVALLAGAAIPWVVNALYLAGYRPFPSLDLTPIAFALTGLMMALGIFRFQMLDIVPVARDSLIENISDGVLVLDARSRVVDINPAACRMIGLNAEHAIGQPARALLAQWGELVERFRDTLEAQVEIAPQVGSTAPWLELRISPLFDRRKQFTGRLIALHDITARKRAEEALYLYARELEASNAELDAFAHTVAHDLKSPLSTLAGFGDLLEQKHTTMSSEQLAVSANSIGRSARRMINIIDELLLLASVRKMDEVPTGPLDMAAIVAAAQERLQDIIDISQGEITLPPAWPTAIGYAPWVEEVWVNYLSNALQYGGTPPLVEVGFDVAREAVDEFPRFQVRFWVKDNGAGLTSEEQERLFTPFTRLDQARARGHGLGLSIVRRIVEKLGGQVGVESEVDWGSTFWFTLPGTDVGKGDHGTVARQETGEAG